MPYHRITAWLVVVLFATPALAEQLTPEESKFFETKIRPVLVKECFGCHSNKAGNVRGGLRLDTKQLTLLGGSSGPAVVPGDPEESLLYTAMLHEGFEMPPRRQLSQSVLDDFRQWIEMGAPDPRETKIAEIRSTISDEDVREARENFWAYQPPVKSAAPTVTNTQWPQNEVDRFVLAKLESSGLEPTEDAEPYKVLRRLCFDLVGLPPTPEQVSYFTATWKHDPAKAVAHVVDRLLEKEQFGERWGRHWLDVSRYAESTGREVNMTYPHAWRYRDYVVDSFNADKPFNEFVQEQIAGDLLPARSDEQWAEHLVATTFLAMGPKNVNEQNRVQFQADLIDEQIDATTRVFLGMSVACARCHDHKFDAIPQTDYYALAGVFRNMTTYFGNPPSEYGAFSGVQARRLSSLILLPVDDPNPFDKRYTSQELTSLRSEITATMQEAQAGRRNRNAANDGNAVRNRIRLSNKLAELSSKLAVVDEQGDPLSYCMGVQEQDGPENARLLVRGEIDQPAQLVKRGFPQVLCSTPASIDSGSSGRLELARWIGSSENPLTARVMANRIWQKMIGQGIVTSTENFGVTGQAPSHPELLDYLACRFVESNWSTKELIREIANSRIYRISSEFDEDHHEYDPDNALIWRANPRRLDAEAIRDAMLSISGEIELDRPRGSEVAKAGYQRVRGGALGDPREAVEKASQRVREEMRRRLSSRGGFRGRGPRGMSGRDRMQAQQTAMQSMRNLADQYANALNMEDAKFRSVYLPIVRDQEPRSMVVFDFADSSTVTGTREASNTANQALYMMNNKFVIQQSESFARRIVKDSSRPADQIESAFVLAYGRPPTSGERSATAAFIKGFAPTASYRSRQTDTLAAVCQSLFASAEFRYID